MEPSQPSVPDFEAAFLRFKLIAIAFSVAWIAVIVFLWIYWFDLPKYVSWPLALVEAILGSDARMFKYAFFTRASFEQWVRARAA